MATNLRGEPNYKRKAWEWFEMNLDRNPNFADSADELTPVQQLVAANDFESLKAYLSERSKDS